MALDGASLILSSFPLKNQEQPISEWGTILDIRLRILSWCGCAWKDCLLSKGEGVNALGCTESGCINRGVSVKEVQRECPRARRRKASLWIDIDCEWMGEGRDATFILGRDTWLASMHSDIRYIYTLPQQMHLRESPLGKNQQPTAQERGHCPASHDLRREGLKRQQSQW